MGSNKTWKPLGNSTKQVAWPTQVERGEVTASGPAGDGEKEGATAGMCASEVSATGSLLWIRYLREAIDQRKVHGLLRELMQSYSERDEKCRAHVPEEVVQAPKKGMVSPMAI
jgi:hypothetical protein